MARSVAGARSRAAAVAGPAGPLGRRLGPVLRARREDAAGRAKSAEAEVRGPDPGHLGAGPDRGLLVQLSPGALRRGVRHPRRRRGGGPHGVPRLRTRARGDGAVQDPRIQARDLAEGGARQAMAVTPTGAAEVVQAIAGLS